MRGQITFPKIELISEAEVDSCNNNSEKVKFRAKTKEGEIFLFQAFDATALKIQHMNLEKGMRISIAGELRQYVDENSGWIKDYIKALNVDYADDKKPQVSVTVKNDLSMYRSKEVL